MDHEQKAKLAKFFFVAISVFLCLILIQSKVSSDKKSLSTERVQVIRSTERNYEKDQSPKSIIRAPVQVAVNQSHGQTGDVIEDGKSNAVSMQIVDPRVQRVESKVSPKDATISKNEISQAISSDQIKSRQGQTPQANERATPQKSAASSDAPLINDTVVSISNSPEKNSNNPAPSSKVAGAGNKINDTVVPRNDIKKQNESIAAGTKNIPSVASDSVEENGLQWRRQPGINLGQVDFNPSSQYRWHQAIAFMILIIFATKNSYHLIIIRRGRVLINTLSFQMIHRISNFIKFTNR